MFSHRHPVFMNLFKTQEDIAKLEEKIAKESDPKKKAELQKNLAGVYESVTKAQRGALEDIREFKSFWGGFITQFETPIFGAFGQGMGAVKGLLKGLEPTIMAVSGVVLELMTNLNKDIADGGFKAFFDWMEFNAAESLRNFSLIIGNVIGGFIGILQAFAPTGAEFENGLVGMTEKFQAWGESLGSNKSFQNFIDYAKENGPVFVEMLGNAWQLVTDLVVAFAPYGTTVLAAVTSLFDKMGEYVPKITEIIDAAIDFGQSIQENWVPIRETVIGISTAVATFAIIMGGLSIIGTITTLIAAYRAGTLLATAAQMGLNFAMLANPITWVVIAIASLIAIGVLLYRNWDLVRDKTQQMWDKLGAAQGVVTAALGPIGFLIRAAVTVADNWDNTKGVWENVWNGIKIAASNAVNDVLGSINKMIDVINKIPGVNIPIIPKVNWGAAKEIQSASASSNKGSRAVMSHATGLERVPYDNYGANLHKDEAVLTARQSEALRSAGILGRNGSKPTLEIGNSMSATPNNGGGNVTNFAPQITVEVKPGSNGVIDETTIAQAVKKELEKFFMQQRELLDV